VLARVGLVERHDAADVAPLQRAADRALEPVRGERAH
jgi:hypothetical protein